MVSFDTIIETNDQNVSAENQAKITIFSKLMSSFHYIFLPLYVRSWHSIKSMKLLLSFIFW